MVKHSVAAISVAAAFSGLLLITATPIPARAAEVALLGPAFFRVLFAELLSQFETQSGHGSRTALVPKAGMRCRSSGRIGPDSVEEDSG